MQDIELCNVSFECEMLAFKIKNVRYFSKMLAFKIIDQLLNNCAQLRIKAQWHMKVRQKVLKANTYLVKLGISCITQGSRFASTQGNNVS